MEYPDNQIGRKYYRILEAVGNPVRLTGVLARYYDVCYGSHDYYVLFEVDISKDDKVDHYLLVGVREGLGVGGGDHYFVLYDSDDTRKVSDYADDAYGMVYDEQKEGIRRLKESLEQDVHQYLEGKGERIHGIILREEKGELEL